MDEQKPQGQVGIVWLSVPPSFSHLTYTGWSDDQGMELSPLQCHVSFSLWGPGWDIAPFTILVCWVSFGVHSIHPRTHIFPAYFGRFMGSTSLLLGGATTDGPGHVVVSTSTNTLPSHPTSAFSLETETNVALHNRLLTQDKAQPEAFVPYKVDHHSVQSSACS